MGLCLLGGLAAGSAPADDGAGFRSVTGPCGLVFPEDHGAHPGFRTEWWYYTGNLTADTGEQFGFQLTFFRRQLRPDAAVRDWPDPASAWRTNQIYLAHAALTDLAGRKHLMAEKVSRESLDMAGVVTTGQGTRVFLHDWEAVIGSGAHTLRMADPAFGLALRLVPAKDPVAHGDGGYSRKGNLPGQASCYYSFTRLTAQGRLRLGTTEFAVTGLAWMDHEFSTAPLAEGITGWDWFSIQLDDQREIMIFFLRQADGGMHPASSGTLVDPQGRAMHLDRSSMEARVTRRWTSRATGAAYPLGWTIRLPGQGLELELAAALDDQEMITRESTGVTYWEGSVTVTGKSGGAPLTGRGYMELTGYAERYAPPL